MAQYIPHPSLMGLQQGNDMTSNYMRMYDSQTSNFVNNMARALAQREKNVYDIMTAGYLGAGAAGGGGGVAGPPGSTGTAAVPKVTTSPGVKQYLENAFATNLALTGRDVHGFAIPGARNMLPSWAMLGVAPQGMYGADGTVASWRGQAQGVPTAQQMALFPLQNPAYTKADAEQQQQAPPPQ